MRKAISPLVAIALFGLSHSASAESSTTGSTKLTVKNDAGQDVRIFGVDGTSAFYWETLAAGETAFPPANGSGLKYYVFDSDGEDFDPDDPTCGYECEHAFYMSLSVNDDASSAPGNYLNVGFGLDPMQLEDKTYYGLDVTTFDKDGGVHDEILCTSDDCHRHDDDNDDGPATIWGDAAQGVTLIITGKNTTTTQMNTKPGVKEEQPMNHDYTICADPDYLGITAVDCPDPVAAGDDLAITFTGIAGADISAGTGTLKVSVLGVIIDSATFDVCSDLGMTCPLAKGDAFSGTVHYTTPSAAPAGVTATGEFTVVDGDSGDTLGCISVDVKVD